MVELRDYSGLTLEEFAERFGSDVGRQEALIHLHPQRERILEAERRSRRPWHSILSALGLKRRPR